MRAFLCRVQVWAFNVRTKEGSRAGYLAGAERREDLSQSILTSRDTGIVIVKQYICRKSGRRQRACTGQDRAVTYPLELVSLDRG